MWILALAGVVLLCMQNPVGMVFLATYLGYLFGTTK